MCSELAIFSLLPERYCTERESDSTSSPLEAPKEADGREFVKEVSKASMKMDISKKQSKIVISLLRKPAGLPILWKSVLKRLDSSLHSHLSAVLGERVIDEDLLNEYVGGYVS
ncbi:uncharacterized protein LOC119985827 isoform X2 [Tripterygium wilfordii]|uniref:uncharacterized protein LOC119985827 isoform X2 n=1 Tax=Tripterygium wilfordii TaxID=458696 RepID=UPI0018F7F8EA|nr:uncharacterized protein LOC119985827 isoform X2 [Tripterygium wilfordii]